MNTMCHKIIKTKNISNHNLKLLEKSFMVLNLTDIFPLLQEIEHFLLVTSCDSLPLTRLEGLKDLKRQLHAHKQQVEQLVKECHGEQETDEPSHSSREFIFYYLPQCTRSLQTFYSRYSRQIRLYSERPADTNLTSD